MEFRRWIKLSSLPHFTRATGQYTVAFQANTVAIQGDLEANTLQARTVATTVFDDRAHSHSLIYLVNTSQPFPSQVVLGNDQGSCETDVDVNIMDKPPPVISIISYRRYLTVTQPTSSCHCHCHYCHCHYHTCNCHCHNCNCLSCSRTAARCPRFSTTTVSSTGGRRRTMAARTSPTISWRSRTEGSRERWRWSWEYRLWWI